MAVWPGRPRVAAFRAIRSCATSASRRSSIRPRA